jgi:hypothetical protein
MKGERKLKLALIAMLSDPNVIVTNFTVSNDIKPIKDDNLPWSTMSNKLTGHSTYTIDIFKPPKK